MPTNSTIDLERPHQPVRLDSARLAPLNNQQRDLVQLNIRLVYVHMKNYVNPLGIPWTRREWDDLIQEGTLGLIRAAQKFDPARNIPFAAFALPRIHTAVRRAMLKRFGTGVAFGGGPPVYKGSYFQGVRDLDWLPRKREKKTPDVCPLDAPAIWCGEAGDTVGVTLREKYERAVDRAVLELQEVCPPGPAYRDLVRVVADGRHRVPNDCEKAPYRRIAREAGAPFSRVQEYDQKLRELIRRGLERDPEFVELEKVARSDPRGVDFPMSDKLAQRLAALSSAELLQRLLNSSGDQRGTLMGKLFDLTAESVQDLIRKQIESLSTHAREELLCTSPPSQAEEKSSIASAAPKP